jgi:dihydrofolate reductase
MGIVVAHQAMSIDGFCAAPNQSFGNPFGEGGMRLVHWMFDNADRPADAEAVADINVQSGAHIMGRNMFGPGRGPWDESWTGWWGDEPPYHAPVFVLTHYPRPDVVMQGGTTFTFVTDGIESAMKQARAVAGEQRIQISGGAGTVNQFLAAGLIDELNLHLVPITLGAGERLFTGVDNLKLEPVKVVAGSPLVTHLKYRVIHD